MNDRHKSNLKAINRLEKSLDEKIKEKSIDEKEIYIFQNEIDNLKKSYEELFEEAKRDVIKLYLDESDERPWVVSWSGGKDSTTVLGIVVKAVESLPKENRTRKIYAIMSDTKMENPNLEVYMNDQVSLINKYCEKNSLPITAEKVQRPLEHSYYYLIIGRGYFFPQNNGAGRWCTDRLKIKPQNERKKEINPSFNLMGVRLSESVKRKQSIRKFANDEGLGLKINELTGFTNSYSFMPIVDFTIEDVWEYLKREGVSWGSTHSVRKLYKEATGECGFTNPESTEVKASVSESCGARFGCWTCPVILKDKSTEAMSKVNDWMQPLADFRMYQLKITGAFKPDKPDWVKRKTRSKTLRLWEKIGAEIKTITKSGHKMDGKRMLDKKTGEPRNDQGTITVEARKLLLDKLLETQRKVNILRSNEGLPKLILIEQEEIEMILDRWEEDKKIRPWLITNVEGKPITRVDELIKEGEEETERIYAEAEESE